ncbi:hypothetical protein UWK_01484 [Desulfocapsa sulfexigens DSM 10523]|uniref:Uncharacterized protein n=1 Tax=Desulfocapsa sulfexigens (strain DSM 10523 / SB164P1) TaxID=1167006 RepID=M1NEC4_DESSD|nr:hypothetical protein [Desulfocapsa sulfexigens]AGF78044.1 hypothetical protein UWK_01484 [Desulfocapsa sulfexigens DSM 10523]
MENAQSEQKPQKSTILLLLALFFLFNGGHLFRTSVNTMYFTEDTSSDYSPIDATVIEFKIHSAKNSEAPPRMIPVFSFLYKEKETILEAPDFAFDQDKQLSQPFQMGKEYSLWVHKRWGKLIVPPIMAPAELGRSQLRISILFFFLAVGIWILRNKLAKTPPDLTDPPENL